VLERLEDRDEAARQLAYVQDEIGPDQQGVLSLARSAVNSLVRISWVAPLGFAFAERFVNQALAQVSAYFPDETIREVAKESVDRLIGPEIKVVIGHSIGAIVAYEAIQARYAQANGDSSLPLFLTLGSPLGLRTVIYEKLIPQPPSFPAGVISRAYLVGKRDYLRRLWREARKFLCFIPCLREWPESGLRWTLSTGTESISFRICYLRAHLTAFGRKSRDSVNIQRIRFTTTRRIRSRISEGNNGSFLNGIRCPLRCRTGVANPKPDKWMCGLSFHSD
jgi:hypothetical protein